MPPTGGQNSTSGFKVPQRPPPSDAAKSNMMDPQPNNSQQGGNGPAKGKKLQLPSKTQPTPEEREREEGWDTTQSPGSTDETQQCRRD